MLVNEVDVVDPPQALPKLPVARAVWKVLPDMKIGVSSWILAGGAHHTGFSMALTSDYMETFAEMAGIEFLLIDKQTSVQEFREKIRWNDVYYRLNNGLA